MPRLRLTATERQNRFLIGEIKKGQELWGELPTDTATVIGKSYTTVYNRLKKPGSFTFDELRELASHYGWDGQILAEMFGVPHQNKKA